jgi:hypothetical protein
LQHRHTRIQRAHALTTQEREETIVGLGEKITGLKKIEFYLKWKIGQSEQQPEPGEKDMMVCGGGVVVVVVVVVVSVV